MGIRLIRTHTRAIFDAGLAAAEPGAAVRRHCRHDGDRLLVDQDVLDLPTFRRIVLLAIGKAAMPMAVAALDLLRPYPVEGLVVTKHGHAGAVALPVRETGHPVPDAAGLAAADEVETLARTAGPQDLVLVCLSGGASALLPAPPPGISLADKQATTRLLLASGADIACVNAIRRRLSRLKGGGLLRAAAPARVVTLAVSDVIGDDPLVIGSGPTVVDPTPHAVVTGIVDRMQLWQRLSPAVVDRLRTPPAPLSEDLPIHSYHLIASNRLARNAAALRACELGYLVECLPEPLDGEARMAAESFCRRLTTFGRRTCIIAGGETTVTLAEDPGRGGRCQEFALTAARMIEGQQATAVLAAGTDGTDGPTDAAGGLVDGGTWRRAVDQGLDPERALTRHDANPLLAAMDGLIVTGPTGTNVMDLYVGLHGRTRLAWGPGMLLAALRGESPLIEGPTIRGRGILGFCGVVLAGASFYVILRGLALGLMVANLLLALRFLGPGQGWWLTWCGLNALVASGAGSWNPAPAMRRSAARKRGVFVLPVPLPSLVLLLAAAVGTLVLFLVSR